MRFKDLIENLIITILFILAVIIFFWSLFGDSPTFEQTVLGVVVIFLITASFKMGGFGVKLNYVERRFARLEGSFVNLAKDFKDHMGRYHNE